MKYSFALHGVEFMATKTLLPVSISDKVECAKRLSPKFHVLSKIVETDTILIFFCCKHNEVIKAFSSHS